MGRGSSHHVDEYRYVLLSRVASANASPVRKRFNSKLKDSVSASSAGSASPIHHLMYRLWLSPGRVANA